MINIAEIISLTRYKQMKGEEKKRLKYVSSLNNHISSVDGLLSSIDNCIGISFVTKYIGEMNQIVGKESVIDDDMLGVIVSALTEYRNDMATKISELQS